MVFTRTARLLLPWLVAAAAHAAPFTPTDDRVVLEKLPGGPRGARGRSAVRELRDALAREPKSAGLAAKLARAYLAEGRAKADPRYLGFAEAALAPWWTAPDAPNEILLLRATIRQSGHQFGPAIEDLTKLLAKDPDNAQARLTRATVLQVVGRVAEAREDCEKLAPLVRPLVATACLAAAQSLLGQAPAALEALTAALERFPERDAGVMAWARGIAGEIAERMGNAEVAERQFRAGLELDRDDVYLLAALADLYLQRSRPKDVMALLAGREDVDNLLLRLAIAEKEVGTEKASAHATMLRERFAAARARGTSLHQREEALFTLRIEGRPVEALELAKENWAVQHEPLDARILVETAHRAQMPGTAGLDEATALLRRARGPAAAAPIVDGARPARRKAQ